MVHYVDRSTQTTIAGLSKHPSRVPAVLTPPEDMPSKEFEIPAEDTPTLTNTNATNPNLSPMLLRRRDRPALVTRISLPPNEYAEQAPLSPPPTQALMSPLPAANLLHAGHTPNLPRSRSPLRAHDDDRSGYSTPDQEEVLSGPLSLPPQPGDGTCDRIELWVLDAELEKIAQEQEIASRRNSPAVLSPSLAEKTSGPGKCKKGSTRRSSEHEADVVDGVILKKPKMNMGAPLGQV